MGHSSPSDTDIYGYGLHLLNNILLESGYTLHNFPPMPIPQRDWSHHVDNPLIAEQLSYNNVQQQQFALDRIPLLNADQRVAFDAIIDSVHQSLAKTFFLHGPGGTGKTFVYHTLCHFLRGESKIVLCCGSSGIAALLLPCGREAHSLFKIPIDGLSDESLCGIPKESLRADLLHSTELIIWDESLMHHCRTHECLDCTLRDIRDDDRPFGGLTIVFGGDFQQILPVVPKGTQEEIVDDAFSVPCFGTIFKFSHCQKTNDWNVVVMKKTSQSGY